MPFLHLQHCKKLAYSKSKKLPLIKNLDINNKFLLISFRLIQEDLKYETVKDVHGGMRIDYNLGDYDVIGHSLETDSPLAPQILWDIVHLLKVDKTITIIEDNSRSCYLDKKYYKCSLILESESKNSKTYRKLKKLPAEEEYGMDGWTFGIPVGPDDASILNAVVKRILELDIPKKEILLCGLPGENFHFLNEVRIVGEDIPAPPVRICTKKNRLVQEAKYPNVCILHDRVFLPSDFVKALNIHGDNYPISSFQSLYFDDKYNAIPRRYSDYGICPKLDFQFLSSLKRNSDSELTKFNITTLSALEGLGFYSANPLRYSPNNYITGSLYITKKSVWLSCPQNEDLNWAEFEDVEHGRRMYEFGIPSRIILNSFTQSIIGRSILSQAGAVQSQYTNGRIGNFRALLEPFSLVRKPLIKLSSDKSNILLKKFVDKYVPKTYLSHLSDISLSSEARIETLIRVIYASRIPIRHNAVNEYLKDFESCLMLDQLAFKWKSHMVEIFLDHKNYIKEYLVNNFGLLNQVSQRSVGNTFSNNNSEYFIKKSNLLFKLGCLISAINLKVTDNSLYLKGGVKNYYHAIINSTPFERYLDKS